MIMLKRTAFRKTNLFIKKITKWHKPRQFYVSTWDSKTSEYSESQKIPIYRKLARQENLDISDFITKEQDQEEIESIFKEIAQDNTKVEKQLRLLLYEIMIKRSEESAVPERLKKKHWEELLKLQSLGKRSKYLSFLHKSEKKKESDKVKDALKKKNALVFGDLIKEVPHIYYGLGGNSMFVRIYSQTLAPLLSLRSLTNKLFAPPILFDCSYQDYMDTEKTNYCAQQILHSIQLNRVHPYPCTLQFVNLKKDDLLMEKLIHYMRGLENIENSCDIYENSYLDLYPRERLVYLTPHTKHYLNEPRSDDIYIIGAFVDKGYGVQASLANAKENGLRMAKFPLEKYLLWKQGTKSLTLNNVLNILLDLRYYNSWEMALKTIPSRNIHKCKE